MGRTIIKQPNGKYAIWSSVVDDFVLLDVTPEEVIAERVAKMTETITAEVREEIALIERGGYTGYGPRGWDAALKARKFLHGNEKGFVEDPLSAPKA